MGSIMSHFLLCLWQFLQLIIIKVYTLKLSLSLTIKSDTNHFIFWTYKVLSRIDMVLLPHPSVILGDQTQGLIHTKEMLHHQPTSLPSRKCVEFTQLDKMQVLCFWIYHPSTKFKNSPYCCCQNLQLKYSLKITFCFFVLILYT